jgi:hypothetical protein
LVANRDPPRQIVNNPSTKPTASGASASVIADSSAGTCFRGGGGRGGGRIVVNLKQKLVKQQAHLFVVQAQHPLEQRQVVLQVRKHKLACWIAQKLPRLTSTSDTTVISDAAFLNTNEQQ